MSQPGIRGHQVIGWLRGALVEQPGEVRQQLPGRAVGGLDGGAVTVALAGEAPIEDGQRLTEPAAVIGRTPSTSLITANGSGRAKPATRSMLPAGTTWSMNEAARSAMIAR
jgi:hypothetical protein